MTVISEVAACMHAGLIQLFCMSTCLWTFGRYLGRVLMVPALSVAAVYLVSGIIGGLASANLAVDRVTVTSTAAVCGLLGLLFALCLCMSSFMVLMFGVTAACLVSRAVGCMAFVNVKIKHATHSFPASGMCGWTATVIHGCSTAAAIHGCQCHSWSSTLYMAHYCAAAFHIVSCCRRQCRCGCCRTPVASSTTVHKIL